MSQFEKLMQELGQLQSGQEEMAKAISADDGADDKNIQAAAAEGGDGDADNKGGKPDGDADDKGGKSDGDADDKGMYAKSFVVKLADGTEVEAQDGTELVKSLVARLDAGESSMAKAMEAMSGLIKGQSDLIKSLTDKVGKLSNEGRGRKTVLTVSEKPSATPNTDTMAKSIGAGEGVTSDQFFAKALEAQKSGRITGTEIAVAETYLNKGQPIPPSIVARVMQ